MNKKVGNSGLEIWKMREIFRFQDSQLRIVLARSYATEIAGTS